MLEDMEDRDNQFRDCGEDFGMSKREFDYSEGKSDQFREVGAELSQKDFKEREEINCQGDSGNGVFPKKHRMNVIYLDREPGELFSDGSDEATDLEIRNETGVKMSENAKESTPQIKKRKFSPIVWDRDDIGASKILNSGEEVGTVTLPPKSLSAGTNSGHTSVATSSDDICVHDSETSPSNIESLPHEHHEAAPSPLPKQDSGVEMIYDDEDMPARTIASSRWANDADSPADEGEIYENQDNRSLKNKSSSELTKHQKAVSPELGELKGAGSEHSEGKSTGTNERARTSSRASDHGSDERIDYMEIDDKNDVRESVPYDSECEGDLESHGAPPARIPQRSFNMLQGCRSVDEFERLNKIDEGTYGVVYRAKDKKTGDILALKKVKMEKEREGFPLTALREINILLSFNHPSIVDVKEVVVGSNLDSIFMVMEYMEHDLKCLMETMKQPFSESEVKCLMLQLLEGINYLHDNWVLHRDLKTSNLLLNNRGELKICDFGLSRQYGSPLKPYTLLVVTLWYRAPELLLGAKEYSTAIDMWSLGCIMAELLCKEPLFNGKTEVEQLDKIFKILGTPNVEIWPGLAELPGSKVKFVKHKHRVW